MSKADTIRDYLEGNLDSDKSAAFEKSCMENEDLLKEFLAELRHRAATQQAFVEERRKFYKNLFKYLD